MKTEDGAAPQVISRRELFHKAAFGALGVSLVPALSAGRALASAVAEVCAVDGPCDVRVLVPQQVARFLGVVAVHRGAMTERRKVR